MVAPNGIGMIPMATTSDPNLQCHFENCNYVGTGYCQWPNCMWRDPPRGGCKKRFCQDHMFEKIVTTRTKHG